MRTSNRAILMAVSGMLLAVSASGAPAAGFSLAATTEHLSFYSRGAKVEADKVEKQLQRVAALLGQDKLGHGDFYHYETLGELAASTGRFAGGITYPERGEVHSTRSARDHEIVHLVASQIGNPGAFFQEGLAVAIGDEGKWQGEAVDATARRLLARTPVSRLIAGFAAADPRDGYAVAGSFVKWLIKHQGMAKVSEFFRACPKASDAGASFGRVFGQPLEQAQQQWAAQL
jgi:hypothetical protein